MTTPSTYNGPFPCPNHRTFDQVLDEHRSTPTIRELTGLLECIIPEVAAEAEQRRNGGNDEDAAPLELWLSLTRETLARGRSTPA